jgi:hypothetical protein
VSLLSQIFPDTKTIPFALMAWENTGIGAGAFVVRISVIAPMLKRQNPLGSKLALRIPSYINLCAKSCFGYLVQLADVRF